MLFTQRLPLFLEPSILSYFTANIAIVNVIFWLSWFNVLQGWRIPWLTRLKPQSLWPGVFLTFLLPLYLSSLLTYSSLETLFAGFVWYGFTSVPFYVIYGIWHFTRIRRKNT